MLMSQLKESLWGKQNNRRMNKNAHQVLFILFLDSVWFSVVFVVVVLFFPQSKDYFHKIMPFYNTDRSSIYVAAIGTRTKDLY